MDIPIERLMDIPHPTLRGLAGGRRALTVRMRTSGLWMESRWVKRQSRIDLHCHRTFDGHSPPNVTRVGRRPESVDCADANERFVDGVAMGQAPVEDRSTLPSNV